MRAPLDSGLALVTALLGLLATLAPAQCPATGPGTTLSSAFPTYTINGQTWTKAGSPYTFVFPPGTASPAIQVLNLTIGPGTVIHAIPGLTFQVSGVFLANGTPADPIEFTMASPPASPTQRWGGIRFQGPTPAPHQLRHALLRFAGQGALRVLNDGPTIEHCLIRDNLAQASAGTAAGGGIDASLGAGVMAGGAVLTIADCEISGNTSDGHGGGVNAVMANGAVLRLVRCVVRDNRVNPAWGNTGQLNGGGVRIQGTAELENCVVSGNDLAMRWDAGGITALARGGGLSFDGGPAGSLSLKGCVIDRNVARAANCACCWNGFSCGCPGSQSARGGGLHVEAGTVSATNCLIVCNVVQGMGNCGANLPAGSGVYNASGNLTLENCTIAGNGSGGIHNATGMVSLDSCIVWGNGAGIVGTASASYCDIEGPPYPGTMNLNFAPQFVGSTCLPQSFAISPYSPCRDAGNPARPDACRPPAIPASYGAGPANDIGAHGGPFNCGFRSPAHTVCGVNVLGASAGGGNDLSLTFTPPVSTGSGTMQAGSAIAGVPAPGAPGLFALSAAPAYAPVPALGITLLIDIASPSLLLSPIVFDASGQLAVPVNLAVPAAFGYSVFAQVADYSCPTPRVSNALELLPCY